MWAPMYLLDTNYLTLLQRGGSAAQRLTERLEQIDPAEIATTIISYHEQIQGWLAEANHPKQATPQKQALIYQQLEENLEFFSRIPVVGYDVAAAVEFQKLRKLHRRDGAMDLKIAAIALTQDAMVLTQNLADFTHIQDLKVADWLRE
jgi:tRNA(fMet)-specific endonuclease VapC